MIKLTARERSSSDRAEELITDWIDVAIRRQCLAILAGSIEKIRHSAPERWGVTLCPSGQAAVRLTVGMVYVCDLHRDQIALTLHGPSQNPAVLAPYLRGDNLADLRWYAAGDGAARPNAPRFPSAPEAVWCWFRTRDIGAVWPLVRTSYIRLISLAGEKPLNPAVRRSHSPGVIDYLRATFPAGLPAL